MVPAPWAPTGRGEVLSSHRCMELWVSMSLETMINICMFIHISSHFFFYICTHPFYNFFVCKQMDFDCQFINQGTRVSTTIPFFENKPNLAVSSLKILNKSINRRRENIKAALPDRVHLCLLSILLMIRWKFPSHHTILHQSRYHSWYGWWYFFYGMEGNQTWHRNKQKTDVSKVSFFMPCKQMCLQHYEQTGCLQRIESVTYFILKHRGHQEANSTQSGMRYLMFSLPWCCAAKFLAWFIGVHFMQISLVSSQYVYKTLKININSEPVHLLLTSTHVLYSYALLHLLYLCLLMFFFNVSSFKNNQIYWSILSDRDQTFNF